MRFRDLIWVWLVLFTGASYSGTLTIGGGTITGIVRPTWNAGAIRAFWFDVTGPTASPRVVSPSHTGQVQVEDRLYRQDTGSSTVSDYLWPYVLSPYRTTEETVTRSSDNPAVIIPDPSDSSKWTYVSSGTATITLSCPSRTVHQVVTTSVGGADVTNTFLGYASNSLHYAVNHTIDDRIAGKDPAQALKILSTYDNSTPRYARNVSCWAYGLDLTAISPWNSTGGNTRAGTLISPRHIIFAAHYQINVGDSIRFVTAANQIITRTLTAKRTLPGYASYYPDVTVGVLDSDVPSSISFARVLPDTWTSKLPSLSSTSRVASLVLDQEENALVDDLRSITEAAGTYGAMVYYVLPNDTQRFSFAQPIVGGDSGNPAMLVIDGKLVLLNVWTFGGAGSGTSVTYWKSAINTIMTSLGGDYQLTEIDLSSYPSY